ncbi:MAG: thioredoxin domain-containing protein [Gemmatimonadetes bacterium]|nr:thioredoxin domain-containing protein [Gemmatimonadota bacterium]
MTFVRRILPHLLDVATGALLLIAVLLLARPGSGVRAWIDDWRTTRQQRREVQAAWSVMVQSAMPLYEAVEPPRVFLFTDYQCPFCREVEAAVASAVSAGARIAVIQMPIKSIHPLASAAARATLCARHQGRGQRMHSTLMTATGWQRDSSWVRQAVEAGVRDTVAFEKCMKAAETAKVLEAQMALAARLRISNTPTFVSVSHRKVGVLTSTALLALDSN